MADWIEKPHHRRIEEYALHFTCKAMPSSGFGFACDKEGNIVGDAFATKAEREAQAAECRADPAYEAPFVMDFSRDYFEPGSLRCHCGRQHYLARGDSQCVCGQDYNACGQELVPSCQWEEPYDED